MKRQILILLVFTYSIFAYSQSLPDSIPKLEIFQITKAYQLYADTSLNCDDLFVMNRTFISLIYKNDSSCAILIGRDNVDSTLFAGIATKTKNSVFNTSDKNAEFFKWNFIMAGHAGERKEALINKEYITGSFEERGAKYFFFCIYILNETEYQFYCKQLETKDWMN